MMDEVVFWLPGASPRPIGGVRVVYELANRLAERGQSVTVVHATHFDRRATSVECVRSWRDYVARRFFARDNGFRVDSWCAVDPAVRVIWMTSPCFWRTRKKCWHVATAWQTAEWLPALVARGGRGAYLVQNDERRFEGVEDARVEATWRLPVRRLFTGAWLAGLFPKGGGEATVIGQGVDYRDSPHFFRSPSSGKVPGSITMMYHPSLWKRSAAGVAAIRTAEATGGPMVVTLFGTCPKPAGLPLHWKYRENPPQAELAEMFGASEIFLSPSEVEGFALPPCEAMLAGCACVLTDIGGHRDAGVPNETALMPLLGDDQEMISAIMRLRDDPMLRVRLGEAGAARVRGFHWDAVAERFLGALDFHG